MRDEFRCFPREMKILRSMIVPRLHGLKRGLLLKEPLISTVGT